MNKSHCKYFGIMLGLILSGSFLTGCASTTRSIDESWKSTNPELYDCYVRAEDVTPGQTYEMQSGTLTFTKAGYAVSQSGNAKWQIPVERIVGWKKDSCDERFLQEN